MAARGSERARIGLRVDVDTFRGTRDGVPCLLALLRSYDVRATFFFSVGPDNMGRHVLRLLRPAFARKMLRSKAPSLYGWDILLRGTLWPGPEIGRHLGPVMRRAADLGHEVGLHAWDHHAWQVHLPEMDVAAIREALARGLDGLQRALGVAPRCCAAPGWQCDDRVLLEQNAFGFDYASDCRGTGVFRPMVGGTACTPQIPTTLPTYDELIGTDGVSRDTYNRTLLSLVRPGALNVLAVHAEVEGGACAALFEEFLSTAREIGVSLCPLGELLPAPTAIPAGRVGRGEVPGREGWVCLQRAAEEDPA